MSNTKDIYSFTYKHFNYCPCSVCATTNKDVVGVRKSLQTEVMYSTCHFWVFEIVMHVNNELYSPLFLL